MASKISEYLQYHFTDAELLDMGREQSRTLSEMGALESKKSELAKTLAGEIEGKKSIIGKLAEGIRNGYEWRMIECAVRYDQPKPGYMEIVRLDTGEIAKTRRMTADEMQMQFELQEHQPAQEEPGVPEWRRLHPEAGPVPSDPNCAEWRTADEIRDGVPLFEEVA